MGFPFGQYKPKDLVNDSGNLVWYITHGWYRRTEGEKDGEKESDRERSLPHVLYISLFVLSVYLIKSIPGNIRIKYSSPYTT